MIHSFPNSQTDFAKRMKRTALLSCAASCAVWVGFALDIAHAQPRAGAPSTGSDVIILQLGPIDSQQPLTLPPLSLPASVTASGEEGGDTPEQEGSQPLPSSPDQAISPSLVDPGLDKTKMKELPTQQVEEGTTEGTVPPPPAPENNTPVSNGEETDSPASSELKQAEPKAARPGLKARAPFSVLFTEQKPFLLYSQDASITYLMPNAVRNRPTFGRYLRGLLEQRAMDFWQQVRKDAAGIKKADGGSAPSLVLSSRIEDRFTSAAFSSLFWEEVLKLRVDDNKEQQRVAVHTVNYDYQADKPLRLEDLFTADNQQALDSIVDLIAAYIRADIIRQKSIRLTTKILAEQDAWVKEFKPKIDHLQTFSLVPATIKGQIAGLTFHFHPGQLGAEADGPYHVYVPATIFAPYLAERFAKLFAGDALNVGSHTATGFSNALINLRGIKDGTELAGTTLIEGEVPANWCDGFHLSLTDQGNIVSEAIVELLPDLPAFGLSNNMLRFRAELSISGEGGKSGALVFEPFPLSPKDGRITLRENSACALDKEIVPPQPGRDNISVPVSY